MTGGQMTAPDLAGLLQFGFVGVVLLCLMLGKYIVPEWVLKRERENHTTALEQKDDEIARLAADNVELKGSLREANAVYSTQVVPTLTRVVDVLREDGEPRGR